MTVTDFSLLWIIKPDGTVEQEVLGSYPKGLLFDHPHLPRYAYAQQGTNEMSRFEVDTCQLLRGRSSGGLVSSNWIRHERSECLGTVSAVGYTIGESLPFHATENYHKNNPQINLEF